MKPINTIAIRQQARKLTREQMKAWIEQQLGQRITTADFEALLRERLPKEPEYQAKIMEWLKETYPDAFIWKAAAGPYSRAGIPDICALINHNFFGFEVKRPYIGLLTPIQALTIKKINEAGAFAGVVSYPHEAQRLIELAEANSTLKRTAIWKDCRVIGYAHISSEQADALNRIRGLGVYFGFDRTTNPEKYQEDEQHG